MRFRWTMKDLNESTDNEILRSLIAERQSTCTNVYSPLSKRLAELYGKIDKNVQADIKNKRAK